MSGDEPFPELGACNGAVFVCGPPNTLAAHAAIAAATDRGARVVFVTQEMTGTIKEYTAEYVDSLCRKQETLDLSKIAFRIRLETEQARIEPPILLKKTAYERANPNQPFYAKLRKEDKRKNRHGRKK